jgi:hypothetical protein
MCDEQTLHPNLDVEQYELTGASVVTLFKKSADLAETNSR